MLNLTYRCTHRPKYILNVTYPLASLQAIPVKGLAHSQPTSMLNGHTEAASGYLDKVLRISCQPLSWLIFFSGQKQLFTERQGEQS